MFGLFKVRKKDPETPAEKKLEQIAVLLFPPLKTDTDRDGDKYQVDYSTDGNLEAALMDLEMGHNDVVTQKTIRWVSDKLMEVRALLEIDQEVDADTKYYIVDNDSTPIEDVVKEPDEP